MDVDSVADELYGLLPEEFTAARNAREKEAKAAGDKAVAAQIHSLGKPNQVAWLANQLSRQHAGEIGPLLELGAELREAAETLTGDQLRTFAQQRNQLVRDLIQKARRLAQVAGKKVSEDVIRGLQDTLQAALAEPGAADLLVAGRLTQGLQHVGFGPGVGGLSAGTSPAEPRSKQAKGGSKGSGSTPDTEAIERAARLLEELKAGADEAAETRDDAQTALDEARNVLADADAEVARLEAALTKAQDARAGAKREEHRLRTSFERADKAADAAVRRVEAAVKEHKKLLKAT